MQLSNLQKGQVGTEAGDSGDAEDGMYPDGLLVLSPRIMFELKDKQLAIPAIRVQEDGR